MPQERGRRLVEECKEHLLSVMRAFPECAPDGSGATNAELENATGFALSLAEQDRWLTWSLLQKLSDEGRVEVLRRGPRGRRYYRLR